MVFQHFAPFVTPGVYVMCCHTHTHTHTHIHAHIYLGVYSFL